MYDVGSSHPGAEVGPKGPAVRRLKRYARNLRVPKVISGASQAQFLYNEIGLFQLISVES